jgi:L-asparaginase
MTTRQPKLIIHGGASSLEHKGGLESVRQSLHQIVTEVYELLLQGSPAIDAVIRGCQLLEDEPKFNAGTGSVVQSDGQVRMSASLMDGESQNFSGVINVSRVKNPIHYPNFYNKKQTVFYRVLGQLIWPEKCKFRPTIPSRIFVFKNG